MTNDQRTSTVQPTGTVLLAVTVPDALIAQWLLPLHRLAAKPLGEILHWDGVGYRLPEGFQFPLACRDPALRIGERFFAQTLLCEYVRIVVPFLELPNHAAECCTLLALQPLREEIARQCVCDLRAGAANVALLDEMTSPDALAYFAACAVSAKIPALLRDGSVLYWNALGQVFVPSIEWLPCPGS